MNPEDLKVLAERASTIEGRRDDRLVEVHVRIRRAGRRRQFVAVTASAIAVVLALTAGTAILALTDTDRTPPANPHGPTQTPRVEEAPSVRRLTYAIGDKIHWGDRVIDVGGEVVDVDATDDRVVFSRFQDSLPRTCRPTRVGCGDLWFTDGSDTVRIGRATGSVVRGFDIEFSNAGSTVVWSEPDPEDRSHYYPTRGEYVAYDTSERREAGRFGSARSTVVAVLDDYVYWLPDETWCVNHVRFWDECRRYKGVMRFDVSTGSQVRVSWTSYQADRRSRPRTLMTPYTGNAGVPGPVLMDSINFLREGDRLVTDDGDGAAVTARVARNGEPVRLRLPAGYTNVDWFPMVMWLDDDRVAVSADTRALLVCRLSSGRCRIAVTGSPLTGFHGRG